MKLFKSRSQWITIGQAANYLGVSKDTLRRWEKRNKLKPHRSPTNRRFYTKSQLDQVIKIKRFSPKSNLNIIVLLTLLITIILGLLIQLFFF